MTAIEHAGVSNDPYASGSGVDATGDATGDESASNEASAERDGSLTKRDGSFDRDAVLDLAAPTFERWERDRHLDAARGRVGTVFFASVAVLAVTWLAEPRGLAGFVLTMWSLASLPLAAVTGTLYVTLRNPRRAREIWWEDGALLTFGLVIVAVLSRAAVRSAGGRVAWQLLFSEHSPTGVHYGYDVDDGVDESRVAELRGYVTYAVLGSAVLVALDGLAWVAQHGGLEVVAALLDGTSGIDPGTGGGAGGGGLPALPAIPTDPVSIAAYLVLAVVVGSVLGFFVALRRDR